MRRGAVGLRKKPEVLIPVAHKMDWFGFLNGNTKKKQTFQKDWFPFGVAKNVPNQTNILQDRRAKTGPFRGPTVRTRNGASHRNPTPTVGNQGIFRYGFRRYGGCQVKEGGAKPAWKRLYLWEPHAYLKRPLIKSRWSQGTLQDSACGLCRVPDRGRMPRFERLFSDHLLFFHKGGLFPILGNTSMEDDDPCVMFTCERSCLQLTRLVFACAITGNHLPYVMTTLVSCSEATLKKKSALREALRWPSLGVAARARGPSGAAGGAAAQQGAKGWVRIPRTARFWNEFLVDWVLHSRRGPLKCRVNESMWFKLPPFGGVRTLLNV